MATTVTETYIQEQNTGDIEFPSAAQARLAAELASGAIVSRTVTPIVYPSEEVVAGKTRANVVVVFRSAEDRMRIVTASDADAVLQAYLIRCAYRKINRVIS
jgi:hypothetical protein